MTRIKGKRQDILLIVSRCCGFLSRTKKVGVSCLFRVIRVIRVIRVKRSWVAEGGILQ
jgi:hypothetical protein